MDAVDWRDFWIAPLVGLAVTAVLIYAFSPVARRIGLVDLPDHRKHHAGAVPLVGGIAIFCGLCFGILFLEGELSSFRSLFLGCGALLLVGLLDDLQELSTRIRFLAQIAAALLMAVWGGIHLETFGNLMNSAELRLGWSSIPITVLSAVGVMNAVNMIDGIDGLCASLCLLCLAAVGLFAALAGDLGTLGLITVLGASVLGFLLFNLRWPGGAPARVFLGDAGSLMLGFAIAWLLIGKSQPSGPLFDPVTALWMLAIPLMDTVFVMIRRVARGKPPTSPGRDHIHHLFERAGFSASTSLVMIVACAALLVVIGTTAELAGVPSNLRFYAFLSLCAIYYLWLARAWGRRRWLGRPLQLPIEGGSN